MTRDRSLHGRRKTGNFHYLVPVPRPVQVGIPYEFPIKHGSTQTQFDTPVFQTSDVFENRPETRSEGDTDIPEQVGGFLVIVIGNQVDTVVKQVEVDSEVGGGSGFPFQIGVGDVAGSQTRVK